MPTRTIAAVPDPPPDDPLMTPEEVAEHLRVKASQLAQWRYENRGPTYVKVGRTVRYRRDDVTAYIRDQRRSGTSDAAPSPRPA